MIPINKTFVIKYTDNEKFRSFRYSKGRIHKRGLI